MSCRYSNEPTPSGAEDPQSKLLDYAVKRGVIPGQAEESDKVTSMESFLRNRRENRSMNHVDCNEFRAFIDPYIDGEFDERERALFDAHCAACPECQEYLDQKSWLTNAVEAAPSAAANDVPRGT